MRISTLVLFLFVLCFAIQDGEAQNSNLVSRLDAATDKLLSNEQLKRASVGIAVIDVESGRLLKSVNPSASVIPASLMKVATTATALEVLGEQHRFTTELCYSGAITNGVLTGDLFIIGGGDPSLGGGRPHGALDLKALLARWANAVQSAGITSIQGNIVGEESLAPGAEPSPYWQWNDIGNYYGAGAGALIINENKYNLRLQRTANVGGKPKIISYDPDPGQLRWTNLLTSGASNSGDQSYIFGAPGTMDRVIRGSIPAGKGTFKVKGSLPNPAIHAADWLAEVLEGRGVDISGDAIAASRPEARSTSTSLDIYESPTLKELVKQTNFRSLNLFAEAFFNALGRHWGISDDPAEIGDRIVEYWKGKGLDTEGWEQLDGSGLTMRNMITPLQMTQLLQLSANSSIPESLPRVGKEGTVRGVLRNQEAAARIRAKSGTLARSKGFCGFAETSDGRQVAFTVVANNFTGKDKTLRVALGEWMSALVK
ncbi:MAG: D-alanyl-D-alanine carboxypeptidase/D-alanyl-D-alanine-endopeptidase [Saprospiraceae bacterium]